MDYEKKYKEALKMAKGIIRYYKEHNRSDEAAIEDLEGIFPELKESEDEKVRNALAEMVHDTTGDELWVDYNVHKEEALAWLEKQGDSPIKWYKNTKDYKPQKYHSVLMKTTHGIAEGEWNGEHWIQYRWSCIIKDSDVIAWMVLSSLEKQGEKKPALREEDEQHIDSLLKRLDGLCRNEFERTRFAINEDEDWLKSLKQRIGG